MPAETTDLPPAAPRSTGPGPASLPGPIATRIEDIPAVTAALVGPPSDATMPGKQAEALKTALRQHDFTQATAITRAVLSESRIQAWRFQPFEDFIQAAISADDDAFANFLDRWVAAQPGDPAPLFLRAQYHFDTAWLRRGHGFNTTVTGPGAAAFSDHSARALADIEAAIALRPDTPYAHRLRLSLRAAGPRDANTDALFQRTAAQFPDYYPIQELRLQRLAPKWGGSVAEMKKFVAQATSGAAAGAPIQMLHLQLFALMLDDAATRCEAGNRTDEQLRACVEATIPPQVPPDLQKAVITALNLNRTNDLAAYSRELIRLLDPIIHTAGTDLYAGKLLELAAGPLASDNRLQRDPGVQGNYALDLMAASVWSTEGIYGNAIKKAEHALADLDTMPWSTESERLSAKALVLANLGRFTNYAGQNIRAIPYLEASLAISGWLPERQYFIICRDWSLLGRPQDAADACKRLAALGKDTNALFQLANDELTLGRHEDAFRHYAAVARTGAGSWDTSVVNMSYIRATQKDYPATIAVLAAFPAIFDPRHATRWNVAAAYNNRCYAFMEMNELQKALDDCNASLRYGNLPDAVSKQQKLIAMLKAKSG